MNYIEFVIYAENSAQLELIEGVLIAEGIEDSVISDPEDIHELLEKKNSYDWDYVDESVLQLESERPSVTVYRDANAAEQNFLDALSEKLKEVLPACETERRLVCDDEWKDKWKEYFKPTKVTKSLVVKPTWEDYEKKEGELVIEIDPGMAFGTGTHETTSLCLELIEKYIKAGDDVLDVGCGSGILAIAAGLLGAKDVLGIEIDPVAVEIGNSNVRLNGLSENVKVVYGDLTKGVDFKADLVAANLMADIVKILSADVARHIKPGGIYISSGILAQLADDVGAVIKKCGFEIEEVRIKGEWCAIAARPVQDPQQDILLCKE